MDSQSKLDEAWNLAIQEGNAAKARGHDEGWYACNRVLRAIDEARSILKESESVEVPDDVCPSSGIPCERDECSTDHCELEQRKGLA